MNFTTLDMICRRSLLEKSFPIHYYPEFLFHSSACLRELSFDTLQIVNTVSLPVGDYGEINLPDDFVDDVGLFFDAGIGLQQMTHANNINPLRVTNETTGAFEPHTNQNGDLSNDDVDATLFFGSSSWLWFWNVSDYGELTGRYFGAPGGTDRGYEVIKSRRQIQLNSGASNGHMILMYISDGQNVDNASQIDPQAINTIQAWINWKTSNNRDIERSPEGMTYLNSRRILRSRLNQITVTDIKNYLRNGFKASIKN